MKPRQSELNRRTFLQLGAACVAKAAVSSQAAPERFASIVRSTDKPIFRVEADSARALVPFLSWDTEGGERVQANLLRRDSALTLRVWVGGQWRAGADLPTTTRGDGRGGTRFSLSLAPDAELLWEIKPRGNGLTMTLVGKGTGVNRIGGMEMVFPFDPRVTPTTVLPSEWDENGNLRLPTIISAPDFGQMLLSETAHHRLTARLEGDRTRQSVDLILEFPTLRSNEIYKLNLSPVHLPPPRGLKDTTLWRAARRGWFNIWQPSARWGEQDRPFSSPAGILANNVISDPCSLSTWFHADMALWVPEVAPGISVAGMVKRTVDWWLDNRTRPNGEVVAYWEYGNFLDANAGPLIAAWDYVEATGDREWLARRIERLEFISEFLVRRDVDGDGLVEATQSGNYGTLIQPARSCAWWDALNCGHKDGYTNALIYRAWRCLADLERQLGRSEQKALYNHLADRLKAAYAKALYNPQTGWLAWWKSKDGELHDYATPVVNGLAIEYGLVEPAKGSEILGRLWEKIQAVGFTRFDLGVPPMLVPVRRGDYIQPEGLGMPGREDGTDTFGQYMNGGISAGQILPFLAAHYVVGKPEKADMVLRAMLVRQARGNFQNGVRNKGGEGIDWVTWDGKPCGYEGYLADVFVFLLAVLLREPSFRARYYRPFAGD